MNVCFEPDAAAADFFAGLERELVDRLAAKSAHEDLQQNDRGPNAVVPQDLAAGQLLPEGQAELGPCALLGQRQVLESRATWRADDQGAAGLTHEPQCGLLLEVTCSLCQERTSKNRTAATESNVILMLVSGKSRSVYPWYRSHVRIHATWRRKRNAKVLPGPLGPTLQVYTALASTFHRTTGLRGRRPRRRRRSAPSEAAGRYRKREAAGTTLPFRQRAPSQQGASCSSRRIRLNLLKMFPQLIRPCPMCPTVLQPSFFFAR